VLIYLDSNIVIYLVEDMPDFTPRADALVASLADGGHQLAVSHLVRMECRTGAMLSGAPAILEDYDEFFADVQHQVLELTSAVFDLAAELRAQHGIAAMDALHLATALVAGCDAFATNDDHLPSLPELPIVPLPSAGTLREA
jgi:predicted nucleic acid-binding protein